METQEMVLEEPVVGGMGYMKPSREKKPQNRMVAGVVEEHALKIIVRYMPSPTRVVDGSWPVEAVESYVALYLNEGYVLQATHYLGIIEDAVGIMFVLVK